MRITELFDNGEFVVTAEVGPPKGIHVDHLVEEAKTYLSGITAVNVTDNQSSVMRMGSLPACVALKNAGLLTGSEWHHILLLIGVIHNENYRIV